MFRKAIYLPTLSILFALAKNEWILKIRILSTKLGKLVQITAVVMENTNLYLIE